MNGIYSLIGLIQKEICTRQVPGGMKGKKKKKRKQKCIKLTFLFIPRLSYSVVYSICSVCILMPLVENHNVKRWDKKKNSRKFLTTNERTSEKVKYAALAFPM